VRAEYQFLGQGQNAPQAIPVSWTVIA
jgi:hypothetical protein